MFAASCVTTWKVKVQPDGSNILAVQFPRTSVGFPASLPVVTHEYEAMEKVDALLAHSAAQNTEEETHALQVQKLPQLFVCLPYHLMHSVNLKPGAQSTEGARSRASIRLRTVSSCHTASLPVSQAAPPPPSLGEEKPRCPSVWTSRERRTHQSLKRRRLKGHSTNRTHVGIIENEHAARL